jgi:hypothetical protein
MIAPQKEQNQNLYLGTAPPQLACAACSICYRLLSTIEYNVDQ